MGSVYLALGMLVALVALAFALTPADAAGGGARREGRDGESAAVGGAGDAGGGSECATAAEDASGGRSVPRGGGCARLRRAPAYWQGVGAQFANIGAQVSLWSFSIRYAQAEAGVSERAAADVSRAGARPPDEQIEPFVCYPRLRAPHRDSCWWRRLAPLCAAAGRAEKVEGPAQPSPT